ncbi:unnamed protein product, partial [Lymnaea stagnalis]
MLPDYVKESDELTEKEDRKGTGCFNSPIQMADTSSGSAKAGFNIPKIKKTNKDNLQIVGLNTRDVKELLLDINKHCLNTNFMSEIEVISVKMVHNSELMDKYYKKKGELKDQGRSN